MTNAMRRRSNRSDVVAQRDLRSDQSRTIDISSAASSPEFLRRLSFVCLSTSISVEMDSEERGRYCQCLFSYTTVVIVGKSTDQLTLGFHKRNFIN